MQVTVYPRGNARAVYSGPLGIAWDGNARVVGGPIHSQSIGRLESVKFSTRYEEGFGGHDLAEWVITPFGGYVGGLFRPGDHVRIVKGGGVCFEGEFSEAAPSEDGKVTLKAKGYAYNLTDDDVFYPTNRLVGGNLTTTWYGWEYATDVLGMPISQVVGTIPTGAYGSSESTMLNAPTKLAPVLTERLRETGERWAVWGRTLVIAADDLDPLWAYNAPASVVGVADTEYATHAGVWFVADGLPGWNSGTTYALNDQVEYGGANWTSLQNSNTNHAPDEDGSAWWSATPMVRTPNDYSMVWAEDAVGVQRFDVRTVVADYRGLGLITSSRAQTIANQLLDLVKGRFLYSGSFTVGPDSGLTSIDGGVADIAFVQAGRALQLNNLRTSQGSLMPDGSVVMIGKTDYSWTAPASRLAKATESLTVTPMGAVPRNLGDILRGVPGGDTGLGAA
jgi:hypothetical protein